MTIHSLWQPYPMIQNELLQVTNILNDSVQSRNTELTDVIQNFLQAGGKYLRPAYFLLFTAFGKKTANKKKYQLAAAIEILHTATLIHDDVVDNAVIRRGMPTIKQTYGNELAVYAGDFLFAVFFELLADSIEENIHFQLLAANMKKILTGELDQMKLKYNTGITLKQYLRHIRGKTAQLFQLSCFEGAYFTNCSRQVQIQAKQIGYNIGMAFQILDDILDYSSSTQELKKPILEDLCAGIYTSPLILAMEQNPDCFKPLLMKKSQMSETDIQKILAYIDEYDGIKQAYSLAGRYTQKALKLIQRLPDIEEKTVLLEVTTALLTRKN